MLFLFYDLPLPCCLPFFTSQGKSWTYLQIVLKEPFSLSRPQVFEDNGEIYMFPEGVLRDSVYIHVCLCGVVSMWGV